MTPEALPNANTDAPAAVSTSVRRLPCRGCGSDCRYYDICDGRPWSTLTPANTLIVDASA